MVPAFVTVLQVPKAGKTDVPSKKVTIMRVSIK